ALPVVTMGGLALAGSWLHQTNLHSEVGDKACCISCTYANVHQLWGGNENFSEKTATVATVAAHAPHL
ncbi:hypothetical protein, partial [Escherichia coli]|uniref:hypothetical protein n=1 Tax=Escherichia coli TaxID=562 RepID=UPI000A9CB84B